MYVDQSDSNVEGVYELQVAPLFRALVSIGCVCRVLRGVPTNTEVFSMEDLELTSIARQPYLPKDSLRHIYFYQHRAKTGPRQIFALFFDCSKKALVIVVDSVRTNLMPNMQSLYLAERTAKYVFV